MATASGWEVYVDEKSKDKKTDEFKAYQKNVKEHAEQFELKVFNELKPLNQVELQESLEDATKKIETNKATQQSRVSARIGHILKHYVGKDLSFENYQYVLTHRGQIANHAILIASGMKFDIETLIEDEKCKLIPFFDKTLEEFRTMDPRCVYNG